MRRERLKQNRAARENHLDKLLIFLPQIWSSKKNEKLEALNTGIEKKEGKGGSAKKKKKK